MTSRIADGFFSFFRVNFIYENVLTGVRADSPKINLPSNNVPFSDKKHNYIRLHMSNKTENEKYFNAKKQTRYHFVADDIQFSQICHRSIERIDSKPKFRNNRCILNISDYLFQLINIEFKKYIKYK